MTPRQRYIETLTFRSPDKIPFIPGGPRESTLAAWHTQGLSEDANWLDCLTETLGFELDNVKKVRSVGADFRMMPQFEEKVLEHKNGHYIVQDWKGNVCEISDQFDLSYLRTARDFVTRRWIKCPVETRDDWEQMKTRYDINTAGRFADDFLQRCAQAEDRDGLLVVECNGAFWQMREWCGFEGLCFMMIEQADLVAEMAEFWNDFISQILERILAHVVPDCIHISEDMAYKAKAMISPVMTREFCMPSWKRWSKQAADVGVPLIDVDSDGFVGELIPLWIESGVNVNDPVEVAAHNDINEFRREYGDKMAYVGGVDKRAMAKGGQVIIDEMKRIEPVIKDGGFIPSCDHGVPADVSWPNFVEYARILAQMTGWL